jgi:AraC-like DNA-binding protein
MREGEAMPAVIDMVTFWRLCAENIQATNDESHGVAAEPVPLGSLSMLFTAAKDADDLAGALERLAAAARLIRKECHISVGRGRDTVRLTIAPEPPGGPRAEIYAECFIMVAHCALRWMTGRRLDPVSVRGSAALRGFKGSVLLAPGAPVVRRGEGATIVYRAEDMNAPILEQKYGSWGDAEFGSFVELLDLEAPAPGPGSSDVLAVRQALRAGMRSQDEVAAWMRISAPTLRRRLAEHGLSFRRLSAEIRQAELKELLATDLPVQVVAERLGLSDDRSLRRFCSAQLGVSPRQYRRLSA